MTCSSAVVVSYDYVCDIANFVLPICVYVYKSTLFMHVNIYVSCVPVDALKIPLSLQVYGKYSYLLPVCVHVQFFCACMCMPHSSCQCFISFLQLGEATQLAMQCDSYNLTNWDGSGFGLNLS